MKRIRMTFFVGRAGKREEKLIRNENHAYGDITQGVFMDHYQNLSLKTISMLEWVKNYCSEVS
jgi:hypothetical protein